MDITTPALLFPAISLLLVAYSNRFLTLAGVIRQLNNSNDRSTALIQKQVGALKKRIRLTQRMQAFGVLSFLLCACAMFALFLAAQFVGKLLFGASLISLVISLLFSLAEVSISTNALSVVLEDLEEARKSHQK